MEELTTKMHNEFKISNELEIKHRCFCALKKLQKGKELSFVLKIYNVTSEQIEKYKDEFINLQNN